MDRNGFGPLGQVGKRSRVEFSGIAGGIVWTAVFLMWWLSRPEGQGPGALMALVLLLLPLGLIGGLVSSLRALHDLRDEAERLHASLDQLRTQATQAGAMRPAAMRTEPARAQQEQPSLALEPEEAEPLPELTVDDYIRALNFPESEDDLDGIHALQMALADRDTAKLIRSAQDVLTLLSEDGIFMEDLAPDPARADVWRRFGAGERGAGVASLGGVRDRAVLTLAGARMREDQIFRDAAHHFLRTFDRSFAGFERAATDGEIMAFADSRTARAFMLLGRVAGTFD